MRIRYIKPGFFKNEYLAALSPMARLCFAGLWTVSDRAGRTEDRPRRIKGELFPYDDVDVEPLLAELDAAGFIIRYRVGDQPLIQVVNFIDHQRPHKDEPVSKLPEYMPGQGDSQCQPVDSPVTSVRGMGNGERGMGNWNGDGNATTTPIGVEAAATAQIAALAAPEPRHAPIPSVRPSTLVTSPLAYERLQKTCAFVGSALQVPHVLHGEFLRKVGGNGEVRLQEWYLALNEQLETSGEGYGDAFAYLRPRFAAWATPPAPPKVVAPPVRASVPSQGGDRDAAAVQQQMETRRRRAEMQAIGMSDDAIAEVFNQEYEARQATKENR